MSNRPTWLTLQPDSDYSNAIQFSIKKPLFAASVVLKYQNVETAQGRAIQGRVELSAKIPIKGPLRYSIEATSSSVVVSEAIGIQPLSAVFGFSEIKEMDEIAGHYRRFNVEPPGPSTLVIVKADTGVAEHTERKTVAADVVLPAPILAHLLLLPALHQSKSPDVSIYAATIANGSKFQAVRIERVSQKGSIETFNGKILSTQVPVSEEEWLTLPWTAATTFEFDWNEETKSLCAARLTLPIVGKLEIR